MTLSMRLKDERSTSPSIMFSHNDLDGVGCGILHKAVYGIGAETYYCGYHNVDELIRQRIAQLEETGERPRIIISDLGIEPRTAEIVDRYKGEKILLDHHITNEWLSEIYDWAYVNINESGTLQVYRELSKVMDISILQIFVHMVNDYDLWIHEFHESKHMNRLFYILGVEHFEQRTLDSFKPHLFSDNDSLILNIEEDRVNKYIDSLDRNLNIFVGQDGKRFGIVFADRYQSEAGHELLQRNELDMIAMIDANRRKISLRSKKDFDVGVIAKNLGGGGHKNASGVEFDYDDITIRSGYVGAYPLLGICKALDEGIHDLYADISNEHYASETEEISKLFEEGGES